jgi:hypothetical protein
MLILSEQDKTFLRGSCISRRFLTCAFKTISKSVKIISHRFLLRRSQWPRGLRHELSSLARTLWSWVRIPLEVWMSLRLFCVCVVIFLLHTRNCGICCSCSVVKGVLACYLSWCYVCCIWILSSVLLVAFWCPSLLFMLVEMLVT